jgi:uncharacterized membrane protein YfcA
MAGLALLTVLSLMWMARRIHKRGRFGRKSSAMLRSLYPIVLGLGGWFAALLIVITTMPTVPLADRLLAGLSIAVPVGFCLYFAWTNRDRSAKTRWTGLAATLGGALVGAWFGFGVTEDLTRLFTAVLGSVVGANLLLLVLDMAWDLRARDRFAAAEAKETVAPHPATG